MKIGKLLGAVGNMGQIMEGIKNKVFKNEDIEEVAAERWKHCAMIGTQPCCGDCGCSLGLKLRALSSECPQKKWGKIMDAAMENKLKKDLKDE
jgi:hypothetical protein